MLEKLITKQDRKFAILIDPDSHESKDFVAFVRKVSEANPDLIFVGGSHIVSAKMDQCIAVIKAQTNIPVVLFPGHMNQLSLNADAVLLLSLISGRNPDLLIGQHVLAAPQLALIKNKVIPTGYILVDGGVQTSVGYMSNTTPIPASKPKITASTALAGELLGMKLIYLDAGSGALIRINPKTIKMVCDRVDIPVIVGGGIKRFDEVKDAWNAGANLVVVGNAIENEGSWISDITKRNVLEA